MSIGMILLILMAIASLVIGVTGSTFWGMRFADKRPLIAFAGCGSIVLVTAYATIVLLASAAVHSVY